MLVELPGAGHVTPPRNQRAPYERFALAHYTDKDSGHDADHVRRILARLDLLAEGLPTPRVDRLYFLACFHGLGRRIGHDAGFRRQVEAFLASLGWAEPEIVEVLHSVQRHLTAPVTVEERIVHDGNAVEVLGAFGIAKAFTTGGARGQSYEQTVERYEEVLDQARFVTPAGQMLAREGRAYARAFLDRFKAEARIKGPSSGPSGPIR
jgi:uncharacterized protein